LGLNFYTKLARLPSGQSQTKGRKTKKLKRKGAQFFCKVSFLWADLATQEGKQGVQETKTRRKTSHSKSLQRMTWSEGFGKPFQELKIFQRNFPTSVLQTNLGKRKLGNFKR
jgi:hypothetical protein